MEAEYIALLTDTHELIGVRELIKEVYYIFLKYSKVYTKYRTISKTFGTINQSIFHEYNRSCLKIATFPNISPWTKRISIPCHFFQTNIEQIEIKVVEGSTGNQLANQFTKECQYHKFHHYHFVLMGW